MVARQHDDVKISAMDKNLQVPKMYFCARFGCLTPDHVGGVLSKLTEILCILVRFAGKYVNRCLDFYVK